MNRHRGHWNVACRHSIVAPQRRQRSAASSSCDRSSVELLVEPLTPASVRGLQDATVPTVKGERVSGRLWIPGIAGAAILDFLGIVALLADPLRLTVAAWILSAAVIVASIRRG